MVSEENVEIFGSHCNQQGKKMNEKCVCCEVSQEGVFRQGGFQDLEL